MKELLEKYLDSEIVIRMNSHDANNSYTLLGVSDNYFTAKKNSGVFEEETLHLPYTSIFKAVETDSSFIIELNSTSTISSFSINSYGELVNISKRLAEIEEELKTLKNTSDSIKSTVDNISTGIRFI